MLISRIRDGAFGVRSGSSTADRRTDTDGVDICSHCVLNVRWYIQEVSYRVRLRSCFIEFRSNCDPECTGNNSYSCILIMKVMLPMASAKEERIGERLIRCIFVPPAKPPTWFRPNPSFATRCFQGSMSVPLWIAQKPANWPNQESPL
jgi:hypothetical protein